LIFLTNKLLAISNVIYLYTWNNLLCDKTIFTPHEYTKTQFNNIYYADLYNQILDNGSF